MALADDHGLVAIIVPEDIVPEVTQLARGNAQVGVLERDAMTRPITIVPARGQGLGIRRRRRGRACRHRRRRPTRPPPPLRGDDPTIQHLASCTPSHSPLP